MKAKQKISFLVLFLWMFIIHSIYADDTCQSGMRKMYLDETTAYEEGSARNYVPALNFYQGNGALWYRRRVLIEPRFEVHLKASLQHVEVIESSKEQTLEGFTIVISKDKNKLSTASGDYLGYYGFTKSYVIEFDFNKNNHDPDDSSYSFRFCDSDCSNDDDKALTNGRLTTQRFDPTRDMNWDFRLIYEDKKLTVYSGANQQIFSYSVDLSAKLETYTAYVGFTGYMSGNRRELNMLGTFVCEDNFDISRMTGKFYVNDEEYDTYSYKAGENVQYVFSFINTKGQIVPHCFKLGIWTYSFSLSLDCAASNYQIRMKDETTLILSMNACNVIGKHSIGISESSHGVGPEKSYTIQAGSLEIITLIGHDGIIDSSSKTSKVENGVRILQFGTDNGDFSLKGESMEIVLDFSITDGAGNAVDLGTNSADILSKVGFVCNGNSPTLSMRKYEEHYQLIIKITKTGTYQLFQYTYMKESIKFTVIVGGISTSLSYCTLDGYNSNPSLKAGAKVNYNCYFKDGRGNEINIKRFKEINEYDFSCETKKTSPTSKTYSNSYSDKTTFYQCAFTIPDNGVFQFYAYLIQIGTNKKIQINGKISSVTVAGEASSLSKSQIFNYYSKKWISIENAVIEYRNDNSGKITSLDLADSSGILMSTYKTYPSDFDVTKIKVDFYSNHDQNYDVGKYVAKIYKEGGKEYIGIFNVEGKESDKYMKRSSFDYTLKITFGTDVKIVTFRYNTQTLQISTYTTCFHEFDAKKMEVNIDNNIQIKADGKEMKIGTIILKTTDNYLYNYNIGTDKIKITLTATGDVKFRIAVFSIAGIYEVYASSTTEYSGGFTVKYGETTVVTKTIVSEQVYAYSMSFKYNQYFKQTKQSGNEYWFEYTGDFTDGNLGFDFQLKDEGNGIISRGDYFDKNAEIYYIVDGKTYTDKNYYSITYNSGYYTFKDKFKYQSKTYTWVFYFKEGNKQVKYYITYDQSRIKQQISVENSYFTIISGEYKINSYVYVDVFLKDGNNAFMGLTSGKLDELRGNVVVKAFNSENKELFSFNYKQTTSNYAIRYESNVKVAGAIKIIAYYKNEEIHCSTSSSSITISAPQFSLAKSIFQIILDNTVEMDVGKQITIQNSYQNPRFNLILYTESGEKTTYTSDSEFTLVLTGKEGKVNIEFNVQKSTENIQFTFKNEYYELFKTLNGEFTLTLTSGKQTLSWTLQLLGDGDNYSLDTNYDLEQTYIEPANAVAVAGEKTVINIQLRGSDGLRWNNYAYDILWKFRLENSYGLEKGKGIDYNFEINYNNKGNIILTITQNVITDKGENTITIKLLEEYTFKTKISLKVKSGEFSKLKIVEKPSDGDVTNPPTIKFMPIDDKGNLVTDFFDSSVTREYLNSLTVGKSLEGVTLTANNYVSGGKYLIVQYKTTISTNVKVTSQYFEETYSYRIKSGPINFENTYAEMATREKGSSGDYKILIYPRDKYMNDIDDLSEADMKKFTTYYQKVEENSNESVTNCKLVEGHSSEIDVIINGNSAAKKTETETETVYNSIECSTPITYIGNIAFHVEYTKTEIECKNCVFSVIFSEFEWKNTKTYYKNTEYYLDVEKINEVQAKKEPIFQVTFYDQYKNVLEASSIEKLNLITKFEGTDIKFCVSNSGNKKLITLCPTSNGDDNINKWQYITNGDSYSLTIQQKEVIENSFTYKIKIVGGAEGSSEAADYTKTIFNPTKIQVVAGEEGSTTMEIRTAKEIRKNYWFPNPSEKIKVTFDEDSDYCSYKVEKGDLPGRYVIKVTCSKENENNGFSVTVEGKKITQKVTLVVNSGKAYYLEVVNTDLFTVSSDKYTWKINPSNDDEISFSFKVLDKNKNDITHSIIGKNEITITSDKFGTNENYYKFTYDEKKNEYLFYDNIKQAITKHVWNILIVESNRKYSFIYTRVPGAVDVTKSFYTIDKTNYIIKESSTVVVTLRDKYEVNVGTQEGRLEKEIKNTNVVTKQTTETKYESKITKTTITYTYTYSEIGKYELSVTYNNQQIEKKTEVTVSYQEISTEKSKLFYDIGNKNEILMSTTSQANINNKEVKPIYKFYLYTDKEEKITLYDHSVTVTCHMTFGEEDKWELDVRKEDSYFLFAYKEGNPEFNKLPGGEYYLIIVYNKVEIKYPLLFLGDKDVSPNANYDLSKTYITPIYIDAIAGESKEIDIEFRAKDNLRWNYQVSLSSLIVTNSYGLDETKLKIDKQLGEKDGQIKIIVTQYESNRDSYNNVLSFSYGNGAITQKVTLNIKNAELKKLVYYGGAVDGTVVNPSIVKFIPKDAYDNIYSEIFDKKEFTQEKLEKLTKGISTDKYELTSNSYVSEGKYLNVQYSSKKVTTIEITSSYFSNTIKYKLWSGPVNAEHSYAQLEKTEGVKAGDTNKMDIYPRDIYDNIVTNVTTSDLSKFDVNYEVNKEYKVEVTKSCNVKSFNNDHFFCQVVIEKSGKIEFIVDYDDKDVACKKCQLDITPDKLDFDKTKVYNKNEEKELSRTELNSLPVTITPNFEIHFYDKYSNQIIDKNEIAKLTVTTEIVVTDVKLCVTNNEITKLSTVCKLENSNENERKWTYLPNGDKYQLIVAETTTKKEITYKIQLTGGYTDGSSGEVDSQKTYINPNELTLTAGKEKTVSLELRTAEDKRKNYWYEKPEDNIKVNFPDEVKNCVYSLTQDEKPGQYNIKFNCTKSSNGFKVKVLVEEKEVPKQVTIKVVPDEVSKSKLFKMNGEEITKVELGTVSVEDKFQMINKLYDQYDNLITDVNSEISKLNIKIAPYTTAKGHTYKAEPVAQANGDVIITITSTYAYTHVVVGKYFPLEFYNITFTHGIANEDNSYIEVSHRDRFVGEEAKVYIYCYDKYNNYIDANEYKETSPYQVKHNNEKETELKVVSEKYGIEVREGLNVLSYPGTFYISGITVVHGYIGTKEISCHSCRINIKSRDIDFDHTKVMRYESTKKDYELLKNGIVEKNTKEQPVYRLYPRDKYDNDVDTIPTETLNKYTAHFKSQNSSTVYNLKLNNEGQSNQEYAEFIVNDTINSGVTWETLVGGFYDLVFTYEKQTIKYNITIEGDGKGGSNEPADIQHTHINEQNLKYIAGKKGYMIIEMRTKDNIRRNSWDNDVKFNIKSCDESDKTFSFTQSNAGTRGVYYIEVTTQKSNTYPKLEKCQLKIYVNNELIKNLNPEQEVSPDEVVVTRILEKYYKEKQNSKILIDGTTDKDYQFEVASYDQYNNLAETKQEVVEIKINYKLEAREIKDATSQSDETTGYRKYNVPCHVAGEYVIYTDKSGSKGLYLEYETTFNIIAGVIDLSKTIVKEKETPIKAGTKPAITIDAFDKYGNKLKINDYLSKFTSTFIDASNEKHTSKGDNNEILQNVLFTSETAVTIVGKIKVEVVYDKKEKVDTSKVIIDVIPGDPDPKNSVLSREVSKSVFTQYKNGDSFTVDTNDILILNVSLYDSYNNFISEIPSDVNVINPTMSGNDMSEIKFDVTRRISNFDLDFNRNETYVHIYQHLVSGTYDFTYTVKTVLGETSFKYNIVISKEDNGHGNGPYDLEKCVLKPKNTSFVAGNYEHFTLELRTKKGLLYNDDIDLEKDITIKIDKEDKSFKSTVEKTTNEYGTYTITIYSEKKGYYTMDVLLTDLIKGNNEKGNAGPAYYTVYPDKVPDKRYTVFFSKPSGKVPAESTMNISFTLADKFNNLFEDRNDCVDVPYLTLYNNGELLPVISFKLKPDGKTYEILVKPKYPPKNMSMNVIYDDKENNVYCFPENIDVFVTSEIDYTKTIIVSKNKEKINAGEILDMWLYTFDKKGECMDEKDFSETFEIVVDGPSDSPISPTFTKKYKVRRTDNKDLECNNEYQIITTDEDIYKYSGHYIIKVYGAEQQIAKYNQTCYPLDYTLFYLFLYFDNEHIPVSETVTFKVNGTDKFGNIVGKPLVDNTDIALTLVTDNTVPNITKDKNEKSTGQLFFDISNRKAGTYQLHLYYKGKEVMKVNVNEDLPKLTFVTGPCRADNNDDFDLTTLTGYVTQKPVTFSFQCYDVYHNKITKGGEKFRGVGNLVISNENIPLSYLEIKDLDNGRYNVSFIPDTPGKYVIRLWVDETIKYGDEVVKEYERKTCKGSTPVLCPNNECAADYYSCIVPPNGCDHSTPFKCKVNGTDTCVKSQTDCDCPYGFYKCSYMKYCVPYERREDMCPLYIRRRCQSLQANWGYFADGICRDKNYVQPTQIVCPYGKVLCCDLTCRDDYKLCPVSEMLPVGKTRCVDQQVKNYAYQCSSTITCANPNDVVCYDGTCVENEIFCGPVRECPINYPHLCNNNVCVEKESDCMVGIACGDGKSLCYDFICRERCD